MPEKIRREVKKGNGEIGGSRGVKGHPRPKPKEFLKANLQLVRKKKF